LPNGDRDTLRNLLSTDTYGGFEQAISTREAAGERQRTEIRTIQDMAIEAADLRGTRGRGDGAHRLRPDQHHHGADGQ
jgi:predicted lipid-binding transport protein (Tim44 family)